jgi:hypothetical protein
LKAEEIVTPTVCDNLKDFLSRVDGKVNEGWMFRGQRSNLWPLVSKFERACDRFNVLQVERQRIEDNMIREFRRRLHQYTTHVPSAKSYLECLALMQHHGAPTRLLDFTYSPHVAAYFAFEYAEPRSSVAIWALNFHWLTRQLSADLNKKYTSFRHDRETNELVFKKNFIDNGTHDLLWVNPFRLNERLSLQRGVFLCQTDVSVSMSDIFLEYKTHDKFSKNVILYTISTGQENANTTSALEQLDAMNLNRITLFPGLDGFAQSLETRFKSLFEIQYFTHR